MPLGQLVQNVLDFCYPGACAHCSASCLGSSFLCDDCAAKLKTLAAAPACHRCAMPLPQHVAPCPYCKGRGLYPFKMILRLGIFDEPLKDLIHHMKYHGKWTLAERLADSLADLEPIKQLITSDKVLVPVPLHYRRQIARGYNQADIIARRLGAQFQCRLALPARRTRNTPMQAQIHALADRHENVKNAFSLKRPRAIQDQHVIVVDDVMTSGYTLRTFARTLLPARPASLSAIVLAIADPKRRDFQTI